MSQLQDIWSRLIARAWVDPDFKDHLIESPKEVLEENKYDVGHETYHVLENTEDLVHIVIPQSKKESTSKNEELNKRWSSLISDLKTNPSLKETLHTKPSDVMKKYGIPVPVLPMKLHFETEKEKFLVLPLPPKEELSESQLQRIFAGLEITNDLSTDSSCG